MTKGLVIYNLGLIQPEQLDKLLESANLNDILLSDSHAAVNHFLTIVNDYNKVTDGNRKRELTQQIIDSLRGTNKDIDNTGKEKDAVVTIRNYVQSRVKDASDISLILYSTKNDAAGKEETKFVLDSLDAAISELSEPLDLLYLGGGHGGWNMAAPYPGLVSGLSKITIEQIIDAIKEIQTHSVILGSCFSAAYAGKFQALLTQNGVILSSTVSQSADNYFMSSMDLLTNQTSAKIFLSSESLTDEEKADRLMDIAQTELGINLRGRPSPAEIHDLQTQLETWHGEPISTLPNLSEDALIKQFKEGFGETVFIVDENELDTLASDIADFCAHINYQPEDPLYSLDELNNWVNERHPQLIKYLPLLAIMENNYSMSTENYEGENLKETIKGDLNATILKDWAISTHTFQQAFLSTDLDGVFAAALSKIRNVLNDCVLTGQCVSTKTEHQALKLTEETGKPASAGSDEYEMNNRVIEALGIPDFTLSECNQISQASLFNQYLDEAIPRVDDEFSLTDEYDPEEIIPEPIKEKIIENSELIGKFKESKEKYQQEINLEEIQSNAPKVK